MVRGDLEQGYKYIGLGLYVVFCSLLGRSDSELPCLGRVFFY